MTAILVKRGKARWAWVTGLPLAWDALVTLTASWQKVFSDDPRIGFFAQRARFSDALASGDLLAPATSREQMQQVVTNTTVDGVLAAFFAILVIVVLVDAARVSIKALRDPAGSTTAEAPYVPSELRAPSGLFATKEEKRLLVGAGHTDGAGAP